MSDTYESTKAIVREWLEKRGHDRCHYYPELFERIAAVYGITAPKAELPPREEFEAYCKMYQDSQYGASEQTDLIFVPGDWVCVVCGFRQHRRLLNPVTLATGFDTNTTPEVCPNDQTEMKRLTWKQDAEDANRVALDLMKENRMLRDEIDRLQLRN